MSRPTGRWSERDFGLLDGYFGSVGKQIRRIDEKVLPRQRPAAAADPTPYAPPVPTWIDSADESGTFPHPGRWQTWVHFRVIFPAVPLHMMHAEVTARFGDPMSGVGPDAAGTVPDASSDDVSYFGFNRPYELPSKAFMYDLAEGDDPTWTTAYQLFDSGGPYGGGLSLLVTFQALCVWGTPEP